MAIRRQGRHRSSCNCVVKAKNRTAYTRSIINERKSVDGKVFKNFYSNALDKFELRTTEDTVQFYYIFTN